MNDNEVPVFVKLDEYKNIINIVTVIKKKLLESKETLESIKQLKSEEDLELENWSENLDEVHKKLELIDEIITTPKF